jgi:hypothetical protein
LVVAKVKERLAVCKQAAQKRDMERFNLKKLNKGNVTEQYHVTIRNKFAALENLEDNGEIKGKISEKTSKFHPKRALGYYESKHCKQWFDEECSKLGDQRKQAKLQWLQAPNKVNEDNLSNL